MYLRLTSNSFVAKDGPKHLIHLPPPLECWDYNHVPPIQVYAMLEVEPRGSCMLGRDYQLNILQAPGSHALILSQMLPFQLLKFSFYLIYIAKKKMATL